MPSGTIPHDRIFKELITTFFLDLLRLFYPRLAREIDPESIEFLPQEIFTNRLEGRQFVTDVLVKARFRGIEACFLIHVEHQGKATAGFAKRFFLYFCVLWEKYGLPIYPIVIFSHDQPLTRQPDSFAMRFPDGFGNTFRFRVIQLNRLSWRKFVNKANPVASALMAKMQIAERDRPRVKFECLRLMLTLKLDPARMKLIGSFVDAYLRLNAAQDQEFQQQVEAAHLAPKEKTKMFEYVTSWEEKGIEKGLQQGRAEGRAEGRAQGRAQAIKTLRQAVIETLTERFGRPKPTLTRRINQVETIVGLKNLIKQSATISRIDDFKV